MNRFVFFIILLHFTSLSYSQTVEKQSQKTVGYACVPTTMIDRGMDISSQISKFCDAKKINTEENLTLKADGCAEGVADPTYTAEFEISEQMRLELETKQLGKLRDCDFSDIAVMISF